MCKKLTKLATMSLNEEVKTQFITREGCYRLLNLSEYSRPNRVGYQSNQNSPQVRLSFVSLPQNNHSSALSQQQQSQEKGEFRAPLSPSKIVHSMREWNWVKQNFFFVDYAAARMQFD